MWKNWINSELDERGKGKQVIYENIDEIIEITQLLEWQFKTTTFKGYLGKMFFTYGTSRDMKLGIV